MTDRNKHQRPEVQAPDIYGKNSKPVGKYPAIVLTNPKYSANVGAALRAASCFGAKQLWWTYRLINEDMNTTMFSGEVWGQYTLQPDITQFLADIQNQTNHLCLGIAKYAERPETTD